MSLSRVARERKGRESKGAPSSSKMSVDRTDYMNMLQALYDARELSRELWWIIRAFEKGCTNCKGCVDGPGIMAGIREKHEAIGHVIARGLKGKAYKRIV